MDELQSRGLEPRHEATEIGDTKIQRSAPASLASVSFKTPPELSEQDFQPEGCEDAAVTVAKVSDQVMGGTFLKKGLGREVKAPPKTLSIRDPLILLLGLQWGKPALWKTIWMISEASWRAQAR